MPDTRDPRAVVEAAEQAAAAGDYASAEQLLREAASLQETALGSLHPDLANTLNNLGVVCEITDKPADAERCFRRAYAIATASLDPDHPFVATSRKNLEDFCSARGKTIDPPTAPPPDDVRQPEPTVVAPERSTWVAPPPPDDAKRSSRPYVIGALLAGALLVVFVVGGSWFRSNETAESSTATSGATPALSPATPAPTAVEPTRVAPTPVEPPLVAPKPLAPTRNGLADANANAPRTAEPATATRRTASAVKTPLVVVDAQLCRDGRTGGPVAGGWRCDSAGSPVAPGRLLFYTRLKSPTDTTVRHRWYRGTRLQQSVELAIRANMGSGYRTYSRNTVAASGDWRVELRTGDGVLLHEERFSVR